MTQDVQSEIVSVQSEIVSILLEAFIMFLVAGLSSLFWRHSRRPLQKLLPKKEATIGFRRGAVRAAPSSVASSSPGTSPDCSDSDKEGIALPRNTDSQWRSARVIASRPAPTLVAHLEVQVTPRFKQFVWLNDLDKSCERFLRRLPQSHVDWIMDQEFVLAIDPSKGSASAKVIGRATKATGFPAAFWNDYPTNAHLKDRLATFATLNRLDSRCMTMLEGLPRDLLCEVMEHEFVVAVDPVKGTASAKVVGHVIRCRRASMGKS